MKTLYKDVHFTESRWGDGTIVVHDGKPEWTCLSNDSYRSWVGSISWEECWQSYVFNTDQGVTLLPDCLRDISQFMEDLKNENQSNQ